MEGVVLRSLFLSRWMWGMFALPFAWIAWQVWISMAKNPAALGPDPAQTLVDYFGKAALYLLFCVLAMTPVVRLTGWNILMRQRRALGVSVFLYALLHWTAYAGLLLEWQWRALGEDLVRRPYIIVGFAAGLMLFALAVSSNGWSVRYLGAKWRRLHKLIYPAACLILIHLIWVARSDYTEIAIYTIVLVLLLIARLPRTGRRQTR